MGFGILPDVGPPEVLVGSSGAANLVTTVLADTGNLAAQPQATALQAITALGSFTLNLTPVAVPTIPVPQVTAQPLGTAPTEPDFAASYPTAPASPSVSASITVDIPTEPTLSATPPSILDIPLPDPLAVNLPTEPGINTF